RWPRDWSSDVCSSDLMDLLDSDRIGCLQVQVVDQSQLVLRDETERAPRAPLRSPMSQVAEPLFQQRATGITLQRSGRREKLIEHSRTTKWIEMKLRTD